MYYVLAIELIKELMEYEVSETILQKLVSLLRPSKEEIVKRPEILEGILNIIFPDLKKMKGKFEMSFKKKRNQLIRYAIQNTTLIVTIHGQDVPGI